MKAFKLALFVGFVSLLSYNFAFAGDYMSREERKKVAKEIVSFGYEMGALYSSEEKCKNTTSHIKNRYIKKNGEWPDLAEIINNLITDSCIQGYLDKTRGKYTLPVLLRLIDIIYDSR